MNDEQIKARWPGGLSRMGEGPTYEAAMADAIGAVPAPEHLPCPKNCNCRVDGLDEKQSFRLHLQHYYG